MNSFNFQEGSYELLDSCTNLWESFTSNQIENAGEMSTSIEEYIRSLKDGGLLSKTEEGKLYVQLVFLENKQEQEPIGFCITSLTKQLIGEVEVLFVLDRYRGNKLGGRLFHNALKWLEQQGAVEQKLVVAIGNERVFDFYAKYGFYPAYSTLFRITR